MECKTETYSAPHDSNTIIYTPFSYSYIEYTKQEKNKYFASKDLQPTIESVYDTNVDTHHKYHLCTALYSYKEKFEGIGVVIDGYGQGSSEKIYSIHSNTIETLFTNDPAISIGNLWNVLGITYFDYPMFERHGKAGTMMALASFGEIDYTLLEQFRQLKKESNFIFLKQEEFIRDFSYIIDTDLVKAKFGEHLTNQKENLCATLQEFTNECVTETIRSYVNFGDTIMFAGGVAHNVVLIKHLEETLGITVFTGFAQGDEGISLGKYLYDKHIVNQENYYPENFRSPYSDFELEPKLPYIDITNDLECYGVTAIYNGSPEIGERALGHRSFLALPKYPHIKNILDTLKKREKFRPYGVMMLKNDCDTWLTKEIESPYMNKLGIPNKNFRLKYPELIHKDGTIRVQTITKEMYPEIYNLLNYIQVITGDALLINTSLNINTPMLYKNDEKLVKAMVDNKNIMSCYINGERYG